MIRKEIMDKAIAYAGNFPDLDPGIVRDGLSIFHLHREVELLVEIYSAKRFGLSTRHLDTLELLFLMDDEPITPAQLAEGIHLTRSAMTSNLDSLESKGLLSRSPHPKDRRRVNISLTQKGKKLCKELMPDKYQNLSMVMKCLSSDMRKKLQVMYTKVINRIEEMMIEIEVKEEPVDFTNKR